MADIEVKVNVAPVGFTRGETVTVPDNETTRARIEKGYFQPVGPGSYDTGDSELTPKQQLQADATALGIDYPSNATIADLETLISEHNSEFEGADSS